jgi:uncharacterized protein (TIGR02266 family)
MNMRDNHRFAKTERTYSLVGADPRTMSEPTPTAPRGPTNLRIKFRSASLDQFIERYAVDVSRGGIFIRTREPLPVDTRLRLEFQLQDSTPLLAGEGTVVWIREHDPTRENVTPGMGVRFDKLTPETQPTLEKILAEKTRLEQAGVAAVAQPKGGGMAVRRPSGVFASLDANARAVLGTTHPLPTEGAPTGPESTPLSAPPPPATTPGIPKTSFLASRSGAPNAPGAAAAPGPFTRARSTTTRPVPVPSALFEPPTAADIDKALEVLQEAPGPAPAARPSPTVPRYVADDASNEPTRVADVVDELVGGGSGLRGATPGTMTDPLSGGEVGEPDGTGESPADSAPSAAALDEPLEIADVDVEPAVPEAQAVVAAPVAPDPSKRFRAASRAYPTLNRRRRGLTTMLVVGVVLGAAAGAAVKLHLKDRFFPTAAAPTAAAPTAAAPSAAPAPAAQLPAATAPATAPATPEGAGGAAAVAATPPQPPAPAEKPAPDNAVAEKATEKAEKAATDEKKPSASPPDNEEHPAKHRPLRHKAEAEAAPPGAAGAEADKPAAEKPAADKPAAEQPAPEKAAEGAPGDKPAAAAPVPAAPVLKVTSSPPGAAVLIDGRELGNTPFVSKEVDPSSPHTITIKKDGYEPSERMVSGLDWSRPHGNSPQTLKVNAKLRRTAAAPAATPAPAKENAEPEDTGGPYIKEIKPDSP